MQTTKRSRKYRLPVFILILVMIMALLPLSASAVDDPNPGQYLGGSAIPPTAAANCSTYEVETPATVSEPITVSFVIEAGDLAEMYEEVASNTRFRVEIPEVTLSGSLSGQYTVYDLLNDSELSAFDFSLVQDPVTNEWYLDAVEYDSNTWDSGQWGNDGWVFRVNDQFPVKFLDGYTADYYEGTAISQAYLSDGDVVHLFYDYPGQFASSLAYNMAGNYVRGIVDAYDANTDTLGVQLQGHLTNIALIGTSPVYRQFRVDNYTDLDFNSNVYLLNSVTGNVIDTVTAVDGYATFNSVPAGTYLIKTAAELRVISDGLWDYFIEEAYFQNTGAYSKITVS